DFVDPVLFHADDPWGWHVTEYEEALELRPGLENVARQVVGSLVHLGCGKAAHGIAKKKLHGNPCWHDELAARAGKLAHERYVVLLPLALSRTQDDKGRIRWTLFGNSEQGPARGFWRGFFTAPDNEMPEEQALAFFRSLLELAYGEKPENLVDIRAAGLRILPRGDETDFPYWSEGPLPSWTSRLLWGEDEPLSGVRFLLTFRPFASLPPGVKKGYLAGELHLLPFPGSLLFWHASPYVQLQSQLPLAMQVPLLHRCARHAGWLGLRVPQSGWLHEPRDKEDKPDEHTGPVRNTYTRDHRWARIFRHEDELAVMARQEKLTDVLFSV